MWFFIVLLIVFLVVSTVLTEVEYFGWATVLLLATLAFAQVFHVVDWLLWIKSHGVETILYALAYVGVGVLWSFVKWFSFLMTARDTYRQWKEEFLRSAKLPSYQSIPEVNREDFRKFLSNKRSYIDRDVNYRNDLYEGKRPRAARNKARIISWMSLWPCSFIGTLLNDPVRRLFSFLFSNFKALYQKMSDYIFSKDSELQ